MKLLSFTKFSLKLYCLIDGLLVAIRNTVIRLSIMARVYYIRLLFIWGSISAISEFIRLAVRIFLDTVNCCSCSRMCVRIGS